MTTQRTFPKVKVVRIHGKPFVCGLFWQPLTRPRAYMKEAREIGKRESMEIVAIRHSTIIQAGFVAKHQGVFKGMYSLAAALAGVLGPSWLGVFALDDGYYVLVAVNERTIVPGCDMTGDHAAVSAKLNAVYGLFAWENIYIPAGFDHSGETLALKTLLTPERLKKEYRLKSLTFGLSAKEWGIGIVVIGLFIALLSVYAIRATQHRRAREQAEHLRRTQLAALHAKNQQEQGIQALEHPWTKTPSVQDFLTGCLNATYRMPLVVRGWAFERGRCTDQRVEAVYTRSGLATVNDFLEGACAHLESKPMIHEGGERASCIHTLDPISGADDALEPVDAAVARLLSHFQKMGIPLKLSEKTEQTPASRALPGQVPASTDSSTPDWQTFRFRFTTEYSLEPLFNGLDSTGIRLTELSVTRSASKLSWNAAGALYAK